MGDRAGRRARADARQHGARTLVAIVGTRQARLAREIEKLALECGPGARLDADGVAERVGRSAERKAWTLADAVVARDTAAATRIFLQLRAQGERVESLAYWITRRLREALAVARRLEQGAAPSALRGELRMPPKAAAAFIADVAQHRRGGAAARDRALADLELDSRGGSALDADTLALRTLARDHRLSGAGGASVAGRAAGGRCRAARDFLRAPVLRCSAPVLTALSICETSVRCSAATCSASPSATAASRRRK